MTLPQKTPLNRQLNAQLIPWYCTTATSVYIFVCCSALCCSAYRSRFRLSYVANVSYTAEWLAINGVPVCIYHSHGITPTSINMVFTKYYCRTTTIRSLTTRHHDAWSIPYIRTQKEYSSQQAPAAPPQTTAYNNHPNKIKDRVVTTHGRTSNSFTRTRPNK